jgi:hypothetical protein
MLRCTFLLVIPLFLFTGCGDLEPDMQDTRTVILNMDFHGKSSSRSSSSVSANELSQYNTHLILALPSGEVLTSSYRNYYSNFAQGLMNKADKKVSLEIPLNTQMKIFAFLFQENYSMSELFSGTRTVGYYGESQSFSIGSQTNNLSLGITLIQVPGTGTDTGGGTDNTAPTASVTTATITTSGSAVVQSTETGTAYLVNTTVTVSNLASITGAADNKWNSVAISSAATNTYLTATGLVDGTYKVYAVDAAGNLSSASNNSVTVATTFTTVPSCSTYESGNAVDTAGGGTITFGNKNVSGNYSNSWQGVTPIGGCINNSSALSSWSDSVPSGTGSFKHKFIATSNSSHTIANYWYSDSNCSTSIGYSHKKYNSITVGDNTTGLIANLSRPSYGYKVDKTYAASTLKGITDNATTLLNSWFSGYCTVTKGVEYNLPAGNTVYKAYWNTADSGNTDWFWMSPKGTSGYSDWSSNDNWYYPDNGS